MVCEMIRLRMKRVLEELNRLGVDLEGVSVLRASGSGWKARQDTQQNTSQRGFHDKEDGPEGDSTGDVRDQAIAELRETISNLMAKNTKMTMDLELAADVDAKFKDLQKEFAQQQKEMRKTEVLLNQERASHERMKRLATRKMEAMEDKKRAVPDTPGVDD